MSALTETVERQAPDLRVQREQEGHWAIRALTPRALHRMRATFADQCVEKEQMIKTDLGSANVLITKARSSGLTTEYVGPNAISYFDGEKLR
ncbi:hypothetical protein [Rhizobium leguminosarum]|uniref:hypothetical protein n=1 Tax=Rhizobium leguminosarum TaxID=384 RepID=UPI0013BBCBB2|nr:hypothetical protein [Rhizobium leguminosarum]NEI67523.1 hypothetical protein [Rhizobium leguminosarum]